VSVLLARWQAGDEESLRPLMPLVYNELQRLAHSNLRNERSNHVDLAALDDALTELAKLDPQQRRIVELRYFGGLSIEETAHVIGISELDGRVEAPRANGQVTACVYFASQEALCERFLRLCWLC
jgi:hypothetical protein